MSVTLHFKDGSTGVLATASVVKPYASGTTTDENFVQVLDAQNNLFAFVPVVNLDWAELGPNS